MNSRLLLIGVLAMTTSLGAAQTPNAIDTPEAAVQRLEAAYRAKDVDAAVRAKDFVAEARLLLQKLADAGPGRPDLSADSEVLAQTAQVLELTFRRSIEHDGFPDFTGVTCNFGPPENVTDDLVIVRETCRYPDGGVSRQGFYVARTAQGWRVLNPVD